jgi:acyl-CoA synthetase (AMP-forming)/AMP-acid ligase II
MSARAWPQTNLVELLCERAQRHPERLALEFSSDGETRDESFTYGELNERARALAVQFAAQVPAGERALLLYPSGPAYVSAFLGCLYAGIIAVPAYPPVSAQLAQLARLASVARDARPSLVLTEQALVEPLVAAQRLLPELSNARVLASDALELTSPEAWRMPKLESDDLALLQYTSGSTARPKGVMVSHGNLMANERAIQSAFVMNADDVVVSWLPLFHDMGMIGTLLQPLYGGIHSVLMSPQRFMERPERWLRAISSFKGTVSGAPDFAYRLCAARVGPELCKSLDLKSWRLAFSGAEPIRAETLRAFADRFGPFGFDPGALYPCYGLAEATLLVTGGKRGGGVVERSFDVGALAQGHATESERGRVLVGCGQTQPKHDVLIADPDTGDVLAAGRIGEIQVAGPSVAAGYFQNAEATREAFITRGRRRFLRTGDLGFEHDGQLFVTGRHKDLIIIRGQNLYPQDIERTVEERMEFLRKGRTVAFAFEVDGQEAIGIAAEVSERMQKLLDPAAVCRAICERVAEAHGEAPSVVLLLPAGGVPVTSSGKLQRAACRQAWQKDKLDTFAVYDVTRQATASPA